MGPGCDLEDGESTSVTPEQYSTAIAKSQPVWDKMTAHADTGTPYSVSEKDLSIVQDPAFGPDSSQWRPLPTRVSLSQAHEALKRAYGKRPSWSQIAARKRLLDAHNGSHGSRSPGLIIKMVDDIDSFLFDGTLRHRILVHWIDYSIYSSKLQMARKDSVQDLPEPEPKPKPLAATVVPPERFRNSVRPAIYINAEAICLASQSRVSLVALLMHELLHAYLAIVAHGEEEGLDTAPSKDERTWGKSAEGHGRLFEASCEGLAARLGFRRLSGREIYRYHEEPRTLVQFREPESRMKVRLGDGLVHLLLL
ncbi:hypothetical protein LTR53_008425 [Teratosphaeriaceae sp. CCFEE 6253]|nr:hypothetical protein LTR53_008425 [Teratosphaeriaceae sp. CCFEE 6253]